GLTPARMIDRGVDVGVEAVLVGSGHIPRSVGLALGEADLHDRLDALEAVLPGHDEAQRRAVLVGESAPVEPDHHEGERMHRLIYPQSLDVLRAGGWLEALEKLAEGEADPRHHQRPRLDAAEAIDALLERLSLEEVFEVEPAAHLGLARDRHAPG